MQRGSGGEPIQHHTLSVSSGFMVSHGTGQKVLAPLSSVSRFRVCGLLGRLCGEEFQPTGGCIGRRTVPVKSDLFFFFSFFLASRRMFLPSPTCERIGE